MSAKYERLSKCYESFRKKINFSPKIALVLGSGLGGYADEIKAEAVLDYSEIDDFPVSTVAGHKGRYVFGYVDSVPVVIMQGRVHYYEGYSIKEIAKLLGLPAATVGTRLARGRERLRQMLKEDEA